MGMRGLNGHTFLLFVGQSVGTNPHPRKRVGDFTNKIQIIVNGENGERIPVSPKRRKILYIKITYRPPSIIKFVSCKYYS
jgi:hypothetical protein